MRAALALIAGALLALLAAAPARAALSADSIFESSTVVVIDLTLPPASIAALEADPEGVYVEGTFSLAETDGAPAGIGAFSAPLTVGIRLKGETSFQGLDGKPAFKLKFNQFVKGQKFLGLKKLTLNNMVQDPSMLHEALAYEAFRAAGVPAPRTGYADVRLNGEELGLHLNIETLDDVALEKRFGKFEDPPQHLYEGGFGIDVTPGGAGGFEVDEGNEDARADLEALIAAVNSTSPPAYSTRVAPVADLAEMTRMWAVERYVGQWDGYSGRSKPHNYYLYSEPDGRFQMLPWGTDQALAVPQVGFGPPGGILFEKCLAEQRCSAEYRAALGTARDAAAGLGLEAAAIAIADRLAPWQALETRPRRPFSPTETEAAVRQVRAFLAGRPAQLESWLRGPAPAPDPAAGETALPSPQVAGATRLSARLDVDRSRLDDGILLHRLLAPSAGTITELGLLDTGQGPLPACRSEVQVGAAGPVPLRCRLSDAVRRRLGARPLRIRLRIWFQPPTRPAASLTRSILLPRQACWASVGCASASVAAQAPSAEPRRRSQAFQASITTTA